MAEETGTVRTAIEDGAATITLADPPLNIMSAAMMDALSEALEGAAADATVRVVALRAEGKAFSAGADVGEHHPDRAPQMMAAFGRLFRTLDALELPVVALVEGAALGGGFELAIMADVLLATDQASFGQPEIRLAFIAPVGIVRLLEICGTARAMEITCSGGTYSAEEMQRLGVVSRVVPAGEGEAALEAALRDFRRSSAHIMRMNVRTLKRVRGMGFRAGLGETERVFLEELMAAQDPLEGIASFYEKRRPVWKNA